MSAEERARLTFSQRSTFHATAAATASLLLKAHRATWASNCTRPLWCHMVTTDLVAANLHPNSSVSALMLGIQSPSLKCLLHDHLPHQYYQTRSKPQFPSPIQEQRKQGPFSLVCSYLDSLPITSSEEGVLGQCHCNFPSRRRPSAWDQAALWPA